MKTMLCVILDRSGSMGGRESDVVGGVNTFITEQRALPDPAVLALVRFDSEAIERFRVMQPLESFLPIARDDFKPRAGTPLNDAIGQTLVALDEDWKRENPERCIVVIVTDGEENESREYTKDKIKEMITSREASGKWAFIYLGAHLNAFSEASGYGIRMSNTANNNNNALGTKAVYMGASASVASMRATGSIDAGLGGKFEDDGTITKLGVGTFPVDPNAPMPKPPYVKPTVTQGTVWTPPA